MPKHSAQRGPFAPYHPGELLREDVLPALGRTRAVVSRLLGVSRQTLHSILTERGPMTPEMALRLGKLCGNGPELWLALQSRFDLDRLKREKQAEIDAIPTLAAE
ncbi:MAG TPA: HigA family addiction module antitoxin [Stellaceae bacterium]|nr:HigA family addiction module antitoxin [Stellaceae bacterium]